MQKYEGDPLNAYILIRIFQVERTPTKRFFPDPWSHPDLKWGPRRPNEKGEYPVVVG